MASLGKPGPPPLVSPGILGQMTQQEQAAQAKAAGVPADVANTWDDHWQTLGRTVPFNVNRARAAIARLATTVR